MNNSKNAVIIMLVGTLVIVSLYFIPVIGFIVSLIALTMGTGMLFTEVKDNTPKPNYHTK